MKRYFIVSYSTANSSGYQEFICDNHFINKKRTIEIIKENNPKMKGNVIITNVIELNEEDYKTWIQ